MNGTGDGFVQGTFYDSTVSVIVPAYQEETYIGRTLSALRESERQSGQSWTEVIVVDDGSTDNTSRVARKWTRHVYRLDRNYGKAYAVQYGAGRAKGSVLLLLDADLAESAACAHRLSAPVCAGNADMTVAVLPAAKNGGFGLVKRLARWGIEQRTGVRLTAPLSGQRAVRRDVYEQCYKGDRGFGLEVGLTLDLIRHSYRVQEIRLPFVHREHGKSLPGFWHRLKQGAAVLQALQAREK